MSFKLQYVILEIIVRLQLLIVYNGMLVGRISFPSIQNKSIEIKSPVMNPNPSSQHQTFKLSSNFHQTFSLPIESGSCCSMLDDSSRSSRASHPDISRSILSILFFDISKYISCFSLPIGLMTPQKNKLVDQSHTSQQLTILNNNVL